MADYFVTQHPGANEWAACRGITATRIGHLTPQLIAALEPGDRVIGVLPLALAAGVNARGARFIALEMEVPEAVRKAGKQEYTAAQMLSFGARLQENRVEAIRGELES